MSTTPEMIDVVEERLRRWIKSGYAALIECDPDQRQALSERIERAAAAVGIRCIITDDPSEIKDNQPAFCLVNRKEQLSAEVIDKFTAFITTPQNNKWVADLPKTVPANRDFSHVSPTATYDEVLKVIRAWAQQIPEKDRMAWPAPLTEKRIEHAARVYIDRNDIRDCLPVQSNVSKLSKMLQDAGLRETWKVN